MTAMTEPTSEERMRLTLGIMHLLDGWGLSSGDIAKLLDLPADLPPRMVARFREDMPLPEDPRVMTRVDYLLRISDALRTYFPRNPEMRGLWMRRGNSRFRRQAPLALMVEGGETGLISVLSHLDCTYAWDRTGSRAEYGH